MRTNFNVRGQENICFIDFSKVVVNLVLYSTKISCKIHGQGDPPTWLNTVQDLRLKLMAVPATHVSGKGFPVILRFFIVLKTVA